MAVLPSYNILCQIFWISLDIYGNNDQYKKVLMNIHDSIVRELVPGIDHLCKGNV